jgi:hypothetical protein
VQKLHQLMKFGQHFPAYQSRPVFPNLPRTISSDGTALAHLSTKNTQNDDQNELVERAGQLIIYILIQNEAQPPFRMLFGMFSHVHAGARSSFQHSTAMPSKGPLCHNRLLVDFMRRSVKASALGCDSCLKGVGFLEVKASATKP